MSCKCIRALSEDRLEEHRACKGVFGRLILDRSSESTLDRSAESTLGTIFDLLELFSSRAELIYYVKGVWLLGHDYCWDGRYGGSNAIKDGDRHIAECTSGFRELVFASPLVQAKKQWCREILSGNDECVFALLLTILTNLRSIRLEVSNDTMYHTNTLVKLLSRVEYRAAHAPLALAKLHKLEIFLDDQRNEYSVSIGTLLRWTKLPTLRHLFASGVHSDIGTTSPRNDLSGIESLDLHLCQLNLRYLKLILKSSPKLKDFRYQWASPPVDGGFGNLEPNQICSLLSEEFSTTLKKLVLDTAVCLNSSIGSLSSFTNLMIIGLDVELFRDIETTTLSNLADLLPQSTRTIELRNIFGHDIASAFWDQFKDLKKSLPNLELLQLGGHWSVDEFDIEAKCGEAGIVFNLVPSY